MPPRIPTVNVAPGCNYCGQVHEKMNHAGAPQPDLCNICQVCWLFCEHTPFCRWPEGEKSEPQPVIEQPKPAVEVPTTVPGITKTARIADLNLKDAFESWLASTQLVTTVPDTEMAWQEFETFVSEILTPVDKTKRYLLVEVGDDDEFKNLKFLKAEKLYINQLGDYVQVEGKKRVRLGKNVATM